LKNQTEGELAVGNILIIDDDPVYADMTRQRLERAGHTVSVHLGPFGATAAAHKPGLELVILDVFMPALSGPDLLEIMRKKAELSAAVMFLSSMDVTALREVAEKHQADGFLSKSADRNELISVVMLMLKKHETRMKREWG
jgi:DNA-binding response OmpR family regulator